VTITDRDRRILMILIPIAILLGYWFLILSPKRQELSSARDAQQQAEAARDAAVAQASQLERARQTFAADYSAVVRLGKAIPESIDAPSLLIQLDGSANGTHINFSSVSFGNRSASTVPTPVATTAPAQPAGNAAAGGATAQTGVGGAAETAGNAVNRSNAASSAAAGAAPSGTTATTTAPSSTTTPATLDKVPLTFSFSGTYFDLADFFHRLKRLVYVTNRQIFVRGRLLTIDTLSFNPKPSATGLNTLTATVGATVYLSPKTTGVTAGATASGPAGSTTSTPSGTQTSSVPLAAAGVR
jgi:Tfp pilus assembly protein PilO